MCKRSEEFEAGLQKGTRLFQEGAFDEALSVLKEIQEAGRSASGDIADPLCPKFRKHGAEIGAMITDIELAQQRARA